MAKNDFDELMSIGVDIDKDTFHIVGFDPSGQRVLRKQIKRLALAATFEKLPRCILGMEPCLSAHFVSRTLREMGFEPRINPAIYVKPFNKGQKNNYNDAEAIAKAALRPNLQTVSEKSQDQLDLQALHRVRSRLVSRRTVTINQIRAFLIEQGITVRKGLRALKNSFEAILEERKDEISSPKRSLTTGNPTCRVCPLERSNNWPQYELACKKCLMVIQSASQIPCWEVLTISRLNLEVC